MLSSAKIGTSSWRYYTNGVACAATEYYLGVGEAPGRWHGRGLAELGLEQGGRVDERQLEALFARGLHPGTGERLGRAWRADAVTGFDLTFSAPKSVSALWALGNVDSSVAAMGAHRAAVEAGLAYLDTHAGLSRRGTDGVEQVQTHGLAVALFDHRTSRAGDPQLHTHALVVNKVRCADGTWRTLDATELFHHKKSAGMIYQAALRNEMRQRLGVAFGEGNEHGQAEVLGVPEELLSLWSKRTTQIDGEAGPKIAEYEKLLGRTLTPAERVNVVKTAVLKTRPGKDHPELSALHGHWTEEAAQAGWSSEQLQTAVREAAARAGVPSASRGDSVMVGNLAETLAHAAEPVANALAETLAQPAGPHRQTPSATDRSAPTVPVTEATALVTDPSTDEAVAFASVRAAGQRRAVFSRADVAGQVAAHLPTTGLSALQVVGEVERLTALAVGLTETVSVGDHPHGVTPRLSDARYATAEVLTAEGRILALADRGRGGTYGHVPLAQLRVVAPTLGLDDGQYKALLELTFRGDFLTVLTAPAGAGKTRTLGAATAVWEQAGFRVVGLAPSARAAAELADATGGKADTLAKWLHTRNRYDQIPVGARERAWANVDERTIVIVDEASMANTLDLDRLTTLAAEHAAKVVLVGDPAQIGVINGPGGMLAALARTGPVSSLGQIHRFTHDWEKKASLALRDGHKTVLPLYQYEGRLHACPDGDTALDGVFVHWTQARTDGLDALMLARTRQDVDALNARARTDAITNGLITGPVIAAGERDWQAGDLLRTRRNDRALALGESHVRNGDRFRVLGPAPTAPFSGGANGASGSGVIVEDLNGRGRTILPADYLAKHCEYGWASTIDSAQGATADLGLVLVRPGMDREHLYVAMTRGRHGNHAYLTPEASVDPEHDHHDPGRPHRHDAQQERAAVVSDVPVATLKEQGMRVLEAALATSGAQDAAHSALNDARQRAEQTSRRERQQQREEAEIVRTRAREQARQELFEHRLARERLEQLTARRDQLTGEQAQRRWALPQDRAELARTSRLAPRRRKNLTDQITATQEALTRADTEIAHVDTQIGQLTTEVRQHDTQRQERVDAHDQLTPAPVPGLTRERPGGFLAHPRFRNPMPTPVGTLTTTPRSRMSAPDRPYPPPDHARDRGGPSLGR